MNVVMKKLIPIVWVFLHASVASAAPPGTMRVDYYHTGNAKEERFSLDRVVLEPLPWPGNPARPNDTTNRGKYLFEVMDAASGRLLYSRGFSSIYGEWETTGEAATINRTFSESLRFPAPDKPVRIVVKKRDPGNVNAAERRAGADPGAEGGVWVMRADGSQRRRLGEFGAPFWSPDGRWIAFVRQTRPGYWNQTVHACLK
jgi:hypothetical protein